jgi:gluconolactonase
MARRKRGTILRQVEGHARQNKSLKNEGENMSTPELKKAPEASGGRDQRRAEISDISRRAFLSGAAVIGSAVGAMGVAVAGTDKFGRDRDWSANDTVSYPDPAWEVKDPRFKALLGNTPLQRLWHGVGNDAALWCEGPVWMADWNCLLWSDLPNNRVMRWSGDDGHVSVYQNDSNCANGHARDISGRLVAAEHDARRVRRRELDGSWTVLCDSFAGKKLNAPNDLAVHRDGSVFFSDPGYGIMSQYEGHKAEFELPTRLYRIDPHGAVTIAAEGRARRPNGLCFSPDYSRLYLVDSGGGPDGPSNILVYDVKGTTLSNPRQFAVFDPGTSDGIRCDTDGNVWCSWGWGGADTNGVRVHHPDGTLLAFLHTPEIIANLCFGGPKRNRLFMCGSTSIYAIYVNATGHSLI